MLWGLFQSIFSGLTVDLKLYKKEVQNDVKKGYAGYNGAIDFVKPEYIGAVNDVLTRINNKLIQSNSATMTLLFLIIILAIWLAFGHFFFLRMRRKAKDTRDAMAGAEREVGHLEEIVTEIEDERKKNEQLEMTKKMINTFVVREPVRALRQPGAITNLEEENNSNTSGGGGGGATVFQGLVGPK